MYKCHEPYRSHGGLSADKQPYKFQTEPFHPVRLVVHVNVDWSLQCPIYEHMLLPNGVDKGCDRSDNECKYFPVGMKCSCAAMALI